MTFSAALDLAGRDVVLFGGSAAVLGTITNLIKSGARVTVIAPDVATSAAAVRTRPSTPCLLAVYAAIRALPTLPATDAITTTRPKPAAVIDGSARRRQRKGAVRLRSSIRCQSSSEVLTSGADIEAPALTTRISTGPHSCSTRANAASTLW